MLEQAKANLANFIALNIIMLCNLDGKEVESDGYYRIHEGEFFPDGIKTYGADHENGWTVDGMVVRADDGCFIFGIKEEDVQLGYFDVPAEVLEDIANAVETKVYELRFGE